MIVVVDFTKKVDIIGTSPLPIEVVTFGYQWTHKHLSDLGFNGKLRMRDHDPYITDCGNYIIDLHFTESIRNPPQLHQKLIGIPGVIETGLFFNIAGRVIIGKSDGKIEILS